LKKFIAVAFAILTLGSVALPHSSATPVAFNKPVRLTPPATGGYEPGIVIDRFNNIIVTAHKQNHSLILSPDPDGPVPVRSMSWVWTSDDLGKTFHNMPGLSDLNVTKMNFGDEGDLAIDGKDHIYFVDTNVADNSFSRWTSTGRGKITLDSSRPLGPFGEPIDDRPWIAAHGDGVVMYAGNEGDMQTYPLGQGTQSEAIGPGRYTVYMSYDHGDTFDPIGQTLKDSGWCRPAADPIKGSKYLYMICTDDGVISAGKKNVPENKSGHLLSFVSKDDGKTWQRHTIDTYNANDGWDTWPSIGIDPRNGTMYMLYIDRYADKANNNAMMSHAMLYTSKDHGTTWSSKEVTHSPGQIRYSWVGVAPNGSLGIAYYYRPDALTDWYVYAGTAKPGAGFDIVNAAPSFPIMDKRSASPWGDFFQIAFGPDNKLNIVVTVNNSLASDADTASANGLNSDIYFIRQK
jgi:hypothetical protein